MGERSCRLRGRCDCPAADAAPGAEHARHRPSPLAPATSALCSQLGSLSNLVCGIARKRRKKYLRPRGDDVDFLTSAVLCRAFNKGVKPCYSETVFDTLLRATAEKFMTASSRRPLPGVSGGRILGQTDPWSEGVTDGRAITPEPLWFLVPLA